MKLLYVVLLFAFTLLSAINVKAQKDTLSPEQTKALIKQTIDSTRFLNRAVTNACSCIDSINTTKKGHDEISKEVAACIDKEVTSYQLGLKVYKSMTGGNSDKVISLNLNKESAEYKDYYYEIERQLNDSCLAIRQAAAANNIESALSISLNEDARRFYNEGTTKMEAEKYAEAIVLFEKAVAADEKFAFAWDHLGLCARRVNQFEKALAAYKKSLELVPNGKTPLQNIAVVYTYMKDYDKAIKAYERLAAAYPDDPETFYGIGHIYSYSKPDMDKALSNMCKAYNLYVAQKSPYRTDAESTISYIYGQMKKEGKEEDFYKILKENGISVTSK